MFNKKIAVLIFLVMVIGSNVFATTNFTLDITGIEINNGQIHVKVFSNEREYKNDIPYIFFVLESTSSGIIHTLEIPDGEYLIVVFQDTNNNGVLDTNFLGIPREPSGISNYTEGIPVGWRKHKFQVNNNLNRIMINIGRV